MKKYIVFIIIVLAVGANAIAGTVNLKYNGNVEGDSITIWRVLIDDILKLEDDHDSRIEKMTLKCNAEMSFELTGDKGYSYAIFRDDDYSNAIEFFADPKEDMSIVINNDWTFDISGNKIMVEYKPIMDMVKEYGVKAQKLADENAELNKNEINELLKARRITFEDFVKNNLDNPVSIPCLIRCSKEFMIQYVDSITNNAKKSIFGAYYSDLNNYVKKVKILTDSKAKIVNGNEAPNFELPDATGKIVSLKDFRGKWVILDFWGTWCGWCIKGFPKLKAWYAENADKCEVIGIDCNDDVVRWKESVYRYELPWVNVWSDSQGDLPVEAIYGITGFPTKIVISPDGIIRDVTVGEDPAFYDKINKLLKEQ